MRKLPPQAINWANPQWRHTAFGIRCRADWRGARVFDTDAGLIIAYSQEHANDKAKSVQEENEHELNEEMNLHLDLADCTH